MLGAHLCDGQSLRRIFSIGLRESPLHLFGGRAGPTGDADGHICGEFFGKVYKFARATLPHLRKDPANGVVHILTLLLGLRPPLLGEIHMHNAAVVGIDLTLDQTLFSNAANSVEILPDVTFNAAANCDGVCAPLNSSSRIMNGSPLESRDIACCICDFLPQTAFINLSNDSRSKPTLHLALFNAR